MKYLISLLILSLSLGCAHRDTAKSKPSQKIPGTTVSHRKLSGVRTAERVKAYSAGRYSDPNYPDAMHERHTVYRREEEPDWNYLPDPPIPLPPAIGSASAVGRGSDSRQDVYAEALHEQNRAMKQRIETLQREAAKVLGLESEIDRLKKDKPAAPVEKPPTPASPAETREEEEDVFSSADPELPKADDAQFSGISEAQASLLTQMRQNDEYAAELEQAEQRQRSAVFTSPFLRQRELALRNTKTP